MRLSANEIETADARLIGFYALALKEARLNEQIFCFCLDIKTSANPS